MDRNYMSEFLEKCFLVFGTFNCAVALYSTWWMFAMNSKFFKVLEEIRHVDENFEALNEKINHAKHLKAVIIILTALKAFNLAVVVGNRISVSWTQNYETDIYGSIGEFFAYEFICLLPGQFALFMWTVCHRFQKINKVLRTVHRGKFLQDSVRQNKMLLQNIPNIYDKLADIVGKLNFCFSFSVRTGEISLDF